MVGYYFYLLDSDSHIRSRQMFICKDDMDAFEYALQIHAGCEIEIWCGTRLVSRVHAAKGNGAPMPASLGGGK